MTENELYHYGVLGMKWGVRRARSKGTSYTYKSRAQKKYDSKVNKMEERKSNGKHINERKYKVAKSKQQMYKNRDKNRQDYAEMTTVGRSFVKTVMMGPVGNGNYNRFRAGGHGRVFSFLGSNYISSTLGAPITILASKASENKRGRIQTRP